jgi:hypothetical protein
MSCELADPCGGHAARSDAAVSGGVSRAACQSADYKRASVRAPLVTVPMTSAYRCGGHWSQPGVLLEVTGVGGLP